MSPTIDAYAAGLFDGEGSIGLGQTGLAWSIACHTGMTVKAKTVLDAMAVEYGGRVRLHRPATEKWAEAWTWSLHGLEAEAFLRRILPWLRLKREIAEVALKVADVREELEPFAPGSTRKRWTPEASERCSMIHREVKRLNRRGPSSQQERPPIARLVGERWMGMQSDLFTDTGWAPFSGRWPAWGMTRRGELFELPTPAPPTAAPASSSSLLPTPTRSDAHGAGEHGTGGLDLRTTLALMPTPRATDGTKGGPNQRGSSGDLMLPSAVVQLLPTPRAQLSEDRNQTVWMRPSGEPQNLENAIAHVPGVPTKLRSGDGKPSPDDPHPHQLSLDAPATDSHPPSSSG